MSRVPTPATIAEAPEKFRPMRDVTNHGNEVFRTEIGFPIVRSRSTA